MLKENSRDVMEKVPDCSFKKINSESSHAVKFIFGLIVLGKVPLSFMENINILCYLLIT